MDRKKRFFLDTYRRMVFADRRRKEYDKYFEDFYDRGIKKEVKNDEPYYRRQRNKRLKRESFNRSSIYIIEKDVDMKKVMELQKKKLTIQNQILKLNEQIKKIDDELKKYKVEELNDKEK